MASPLSSAYAQAWERVLPCFRSSLVFLDTASAESLHWSVGGVGALLRAGALSVRGLTGPLGDPGQGRAVLVLNGPPRGRELDALRDLVLGSCFQHYQVLLIAPAAPEERSRLEEQIRRWMGDDTGLVEVVNAPLAWAPLAPYLILAPALATLFPPLPADFQRMSGRPRAERKRPLPPTAETELPSALQAQIRGLARELASLLEELGVREECFALGTVSRLVAGELAGDPQSKNRRKTAPHRCSLLLIDRSLDLTGAVGHHGDSLVEKIISTLPRLPGHTIDVAVNMVELTALHMDDTSKNVIAPGCLAQPTEPAAKALWESMLSLKHKEAVMEVRRHLVEAASRENLPIKMSMGRVTAEQLSTYVQLFKNNLQALENHCGLLQLGLATSQTLKHPDYAKWDNFLAFERLLLQNIGESDLPKVLLQLLPMVKSHSRRKADDYSPDDLLVLLVYIYSVVGEIPLDKDLDAAEEELKKALVRVFCDEPELSSLLQKITGCGSSPELTFQKANTVVDNIFRTLRDVTRARMHMKQFNSVYVPGSNTNPAAYKPLLKQVLEEIFQADRPDSMDIEHMSSGLTDLLKTGFSMFMKVSRPHPSDHPLLILFMVGGVTASEVRMVKDLINAQKPNFQVIVMSNRLLKPVDIPEMLFAAERLHPNIGV
ncbi:hypothetical protein NDU88_002701 [Pleurodeles waltl]|uniref:Sec1 family domain-containing protein 2 n=1 Tax=Pleurodeles waltl TaxID=8319 RepID=A0AAV7WQ92_PLEWA|nr:hypothetical protein NDU88_002701 [Pleurodeles waltl]